MTTLKQQPTFPVFDASKPKQEKTVFNKGTASEWTANLPTHDYAEHLRAVFQIVSSQRRTKNWKNPINVRLDLTDAEMEDVSEAIIFVCGSPTEFEPIPGGKNGKQRYRVTAAGYYACIGS
jgi:hypothetical protein